MNRTAIVAFFLLTLAAGVALGGSPVEAESQWVPGEPIVDGRDGQTYRTVVIGDQVWLADNMNLGELVASDAPGAIMKDNGVVEKYCWDDDERNCDGSDGLMKRGGFYEWEEAVQYWNGQPEMPVQGVCPDGWHIPSGAEWSVLFGQLGGNSAYEKLIVGGGSGFEAEMTGYR